MQAAQAASSCTLASQTLPMCLCCAVHPPLTSPLLLPPLGGPCCRPYKHNEYERFIPQAYPYYAAVVSMMAGFFAVGMAFLYTK